MAAAVRVEQLSKRYRISHLRREAYATLRETLAEREESIPNPESQVPKSIRLKIEKMFRQAELDKTYKSKMRLKEELDSWGLFNDYLDRFLDLFDLATHHWAAGECGIQHIRQGEIGGVLGFTGDDVKRIVMAHVRANKFEVCRIFCGDISRGWHFHFGGGFDQFRVG